MRLTLAEIVEALKEANPVLIQGDPGTVFSGVTTDSRKAGPGQLFVPLAGDRFDGHDFIGPALEAGAAGTLAEGSRIGNGDSRPPGTAVIQVSDTLAALGLTARYWRSGLEAQVLAISGSMGKSTVKEMTAAILGLGFKVHKNEGNLNNLIGLPLTLLEAGKETEKVIVELGINQPGEMERLAEIALADVALLTNVGPVHLEGLGSMAGVVRAKTELWKRLKPGGVAVVNLDDEALKEAAAGLNGEKLTFGTAEKSPRADVLLRQVRADGNGGLLLILEVGGKVCETTLATVGLFQGINAAAAAAGAYALGAGLDQICGGLAEFRPISHRMRLVQGVKGLTLLDDAYNANPKAMDQALATLVQLTPRGSRSVAALGQMAELGEAAEEAHQRLGRSVAKAGVDLLIAVGPFAERVVKAAREAGLKEAFEVADPGQAAKKLEELCGSGDLVLIKGSRVARMEELVSLLAQDGDGA